MINHIFQLHSFPKDNLTVVRDQPLNPKLKNLGRLKVMPKISGAFSIFIKGVSCYNSDKKTGIFCLCIDSMLLYAK